MLQVTTWLPNAVSSADDTQIPSIENALYFLSCGPTEIAWVRLLECRDSNTVTHSRLWVALEIPE